MNADSGLYTTVSPSKSAITMFLLPALLIMIVVSLFTKQHNQLNAVDEFYCRLDTAVGDEQKIRDAGFKVDRLRGSRFRSGPYKIAGGHRLSGSGADPL